MSKLNGLGKTCCITEFKTSLALSLRTNYWRKFRYYMDKKKTSLNLTVTKYLTFYLSRYFLWTIKINCRRFLSRLSTNVMTLLLTQIHSETNIFLSTKVVWEREKRGFISYLSAWGSDQRVCLKTLPSRKNEIYLWKMATKFGMYSANQSDCRIRYCAL